LLLSGQEQIFLKQTAKSPLPLKKLARVGIREQENGGTNINESGLVRSDPVRNGRRLQLGLDLWIVVCGHCECSAGCLGYISTGHDWK
jgi:hypothetical protein